MYKRILLLVDSAESSGVAAERAIAMARECKAELIALAVVDTATLKELLTYRIMVAQEMEEYERELEQSGRRQLALVEEQARKAGVTVQSVHKKGAIHSVVVAHQETAKADLVVISAFKATQITRDLLAKEKQFIIDEAKCDVMIVKKV
ncbi:MAG TPA: universal stress protein [Planctomycetota bacterium]|nr:universal stress protein [Planctomycetota bacterium]HUW33220.1 universal stress protein [Planctomycetota bacterium]